MPYFFKNLSSCYTLKYFKIVFKNILHDLCEFLTNHFKIQDVSSLFSFLRKLAQCLAYYLLCARAAQSCHSIVAEICISKAWMLNFQHS